MSTSTAVKVLIADREYPLKVNNDELEQVKEAENEIKEKLKTLKASYQVKEKQDLLAMCLLQMVVEKNGKKEQRTEDADVHRKIVDLESFISDYLSKH